MKLMAMDMNTEAKVATRLEEAEGGGGGDGDDGGGGGEEDGVVGAGVPGGEGGEGVLLAATVMASFWPLVQWLDNVQK